MEIARCPRFLHLPFKGCQQRMEVRELQNLHSHWVHLKENSPHQEID
jgi:hypothetical protein